MQACCIRSESENVGYCERGVSESPEVLKKSGEDERSAEGCTRFVVYEVSGRKKGFEKRIFFA